LANLLTYRQFINEAEEYSPVEAYKPIATALSRAFNILFYLESIATPDVNERKWSLFSSKLKKVDNLDDKFEIIRDYMEEKHLELKTYTSSRFTGKTGYYGRVFDVGLLSERLPNVIDNLKQASDLLTKSLSSKDKKARLDILNTGIPEKRENIFESYLPLLENRKAPYDSDIIKLIQNIEGKLASLTMLTNSLVTVYPDSKEYTQNVANAYLEPIRRDLKKIIERKENISTGKLPRTTIKAYRRDGWDISTSAEKSAVDLFTELEELIDKINVAGDKIRKASKKVEATLLSGNAAQEWINSANAMLDAIEDQIRDKEETERLRKRRASMLPVSDDENSSTPSGGESEWDGLKDIERLKTIIRGRGE
jgi:hypothetical protein